MSINKQEYSVRISETTDMLVGLFHTIWLVEGHMFAAIKIPVLIGFARFSIQQTHVLHSLA